MNRAVVSIVMVIVVFLPACRSARTRTADVAPTSHAPSVSRSASPTSAAPESSSIATTSTAEAPLASTPPLSIEPPPPNFKELFPGIRVDVARKIVEFDGEIAIDCHHPQTPRVYLEVLVCSPDTREHESIVVTRARPSLVHAAILAVGLKEGKPGSWEWDEASKRLLSVPPTGDPLRVELVVSGVARNLAAYAVRADTGAALSEPTSQDQAPPGFLFTGSTLRTRGGAERYEADGAGTLVGLTTFGTETIAWSRMYSPDASLEDPVWIANAAVVPPRGTKVSVRLSTPSHTP